MTLSDHIFAFCFVALFPTSGFVLFRRTVEAIKRGEASRLRLYARTTTTQWILAAMALAIWLGNGRDWDVLGLGFEPDAGFALAGAVNLHIQQWQSGAEVVPERVFRIVDLVFKGIQR